MYSIIFVLIFYLWNTKNFCSADPHEDLFGSGTLSKGIKVNFIFSYAQFTNKYYLPINFEISEIISNFNTSKSEAKGPYCVGMCEGPCVLISLVGVLECQGSKGQIISKCLFGVFNFFQKTNENTSHSSKNEFIHSFFGRIHGLTVCFRN